MRPSDLPDVTGSEVIAFVYREYGAEALREMFRQLLTVRSSVVYRGIYDTYISVLRDLGLNAPADITEEMDKLAPHRWELPHPWYMDTGPQYERDAWDKKMKKMREEYEASRNGKED
jgi:hypothetical protein